MKQFLKHRSKRGNYHGWALMVRGAEKPLAHTTCTTRQELRELWAEEKLWMRRDVDMVKVRIIVEVVK